MERRTACTLVLVALVVCSGVASSAATASTARNAQPHRTVGDSSSDAGGSVLSTTPNATTRNGTSSDTFSGTVVVESESILSNSTTTARVWANRSSGAYRIEFDSSGNRTWDVVVSNGSHVWAYDREEGRVVTTSRVHGDFADEATSGVRPFYFDDLLYSPADLAARLELYHVRSLGRETVQGRETFVLQLRKTVRGPYNVPERTTLWLDANHSFPVRMESVSHGFGLEARRTLSYRNLTFGDTVDPTRFTFEPPADANVTRPDALRTDYVPEPNLPADFRQAGSGSSTAATIENGTRNVQWRTLTTEYRNLTTSVVVVNHTRPHPRGNFTVGEGIATIRANLRDRFPVPAGESVTAVDVRGVTGAAWTANGTAYVAWPCEASYYLVRGPLSQSAMNEVARTVACGDGAASTSTALDPHTSASASEFDSGPSSANATRIAPGVTTAGIADPARLVAAHHESVTASDFAAVVNETRRVQRANGTATIRFGQRFRYDAVSGTYIASYRNESAARGPTVVWGNGTAAVARTTIAGHGFYEPPGAPSSSVPSGSSYLLSTFQKYEFEVRETTNLTDPTRTRMRLRDERAEVSATLVLDSEGRIYSFALSSSADSAGAVRRVEYRLLPERDVPERRPGWVADAPADLEFRAQIGMEVEPNYVYLSHTRGETVPAGTVVELTTGGETYETRLSEPLRPGEDRQLYVRNSSLTVTADHSAAKRLGANLSSPVEVLVYTERGVLVYRERFRWEEGDVLSVALSSETALANRYSRSVVPSRS